ncbi:SUMF1/EgtB/PvdO family nonheme iron enzyme [Rhizobium sp. L1K21]|uniref:formylglycine-generating enzyme family protein n=1 Tax=Rhizobium sp. L1K21 TaxID=2954933 RepID=UPI0020921E17|nr:SUMF1/EgtB/PvdO family nonheme iron enzyme [Rhizobium sp. L1K21]MCO6187766.1 formylglycine-generating enzyme family protein [Rhizobium sp. L1K21]
MNPAAARLADHRATRLGLAGLLAAALAIGAAYAMRGPDMRYVPQMAEQPVAMPDGRLIYVQKYEVTIAEWNACFEDGACSEALRPKPGKEPEDTPATGLNYLDILQYVLWIGQRAHHPFRLPSMEEWEFMAKDVLPKEPDPIFTSPDLRWASTYMTAGLAPRTLKTKGSFSISKEGVADLDGSVWEWTDDCYSGEGEQPVPRERCPAFFAGGEHIAAIPYIERDPARGGCAVGAPPAHLGFRLVTDEPVLPVTQK